MVDHYPPELTSRLVLSIINPWLWVWVLNDTAWGFWVGSKHYIHGDSAAAASAAAACPLLPKYRVQG
jgi:hypothetical protein